MAAHLPQPPTPAGAPGSPAPRCPPEAPRPRHGCPTISLHRRRTGRRLRHSARALQVPPRGPPVEDDRDEPEAAGGGRTLQHVDLEDAAEQLGPDEVPPGAGPRDVRRRPAGVVCNGARPRNDLRPPARAECEDAVVPDQVLRWPRNQRGQPGVELLRRELERDGAVAPRRLQRQIHPAVVEPSEPLIRHRRPEALSNAPMATSA